MLHQPIGDGRECIGRDAAQVLLGAHSRTYSLSPVPDLSGPSLVQARWDLPFTQTIAAAMGFPPGRHPNAPGPRDHPGYWCNMQAKCPHSAINSNSTET